MTIARKQNIMGVMLGALMSASVYGNDINNSSLEEKVINIEKKTQYNELHLSRFNSWIEKTIHYTKKYNTSALIIDKTAYSLFLCRNGKVTNEYNIELGFNPIDDKVQEGDGTTPEGIYKVTWKRDKGQTSFYRALLINFPNDVDRQEFKEAKKKKIVSNNATIGGSIEVHGYGSGKKGNQDGANWTLGCIAISNSSIDEIFPYTKNGMWITIVKYGAENYFNNIKTK